MRKSKSPSFENLVTFLSRKKAQSRASLHHSEIECMPDATMDSS